MATEEGGWTWNGALTAFRRSTGPGPGGTDGENRGPWFAPVAQVHPQTTDHRKMPLRVRVQPDHGNGNGIGRVDTERGPDSV